MKKYINNKCYNTATAKLLGDWYTKGLSNRDFAYVEEELYVKRSGEYFLHGKGGAMSKYGKIVNRSAVGSEEIIPLSYEEAKVWAEKHLEPDKYDKIFGEIAESDNSENVRVHVSLRSDVAEQLKRNAQQKHMNTSEYVAYLIKTVK